jgi:hypothetical protein
VGDHIVERTKRIMVKKNDLRAEPPMAPAAAASAHRRAAPVTLDRQSNGNPKSDLPAGAERAGAPARRRGKPARDFWLSCGHQLLDRGAGGGLVVTDEFLKVYLGRPELMPPPEASEAERDLHQSLLADARRRVTGRELAAIADAEARENWELMIRFRDHLLRHKTLEASYLALARQGAGKTPPMFVDQLAHVIMRNALDGCNDAYLLRAAELFFREQRLTVHDGALLAVDEETVTGLGGAPVSPLVSVLGLPASAKIDVMVDDTAASYWRRSDRFDMAFDLTAGRRGLAALGEVMGQWVLHMLSVEVDIEALVEVNEANFNWFVGLDADGAEIGEALWNGEELDEQTRGRIVGLYRLTFRNPQLVADPLQGDPVYLILAMSEDHVLRLQPQNLLTGLPIRHLGSVS